MMRSSADAAQWLLDHSLALFGILLSSQALVLLYAIPGGEQPELTEANRLFQLMSGTAYGAASFWLLLRSRTLVRIARNNLWLFVLVGLALISALWSPIPGVTVRRSLALSLHFAFVLFLVLRFSPEALLHLVFTALTASALVSLVLVAVAPDLGIHHGDTHAGAWRGVFGHKNSTGRMMSVAVVVGGLLIAHARGRRILYFIATLPALLMLAMSASASALVAAAAALISVPPLLAVRGIRSSVMPRLLVVLCVLGLGACLAAAVFEPTLTLLGRDPTLTGRTRLWQLAFSSGLENPLFGVGYRTFWVDSGPGTRVMGTVSWGENNIGNGHNGYLDLWLELGTFGTMVFAGLLLSAMRRILHGPSARYDVAGLWLGVLFVHIHVYAVTEVTLLTHSDLSWTLFVAFYIYMTASLINVRLEAQRRLPGMLGSKLQSGGPAS